MTASLLIALKKILGGIVSIFLIAGIKKSKNLLHIKSIRKHIEEEFQRNRTKAMQRYGNDIDVFIAQNYPDKETFKGLLIINAFRPLLVVILISVLDFQNAYIILFEIFLVVLIFPIESYFGDEWKDKKWYVWIIIGLWLTAWAILSYSNYLQTANTSTFSINCKTTLNDSLNVIIDTMKTE
jgi:hypothetical protein